MRSELKTAFRLLTFRAASDEVRALSGRHLMLGLLFTWLVGMGRWWEDPRANWLQHLGIGSVVYVFILSFFLWLVLWPLAPGSWSLINVLAFVSLTSPPAILYALPVRHGLELHWAQTVRLWMLAVVAGWRVALLIFYLQRSGFSGGRIIVASLFPLILIVFTLTVLNLEKVVFNIMDGIHKEDATVNDSAYVVLFFISAGSVLLFLPLLASYLIIAVRTVLFKVGRKAGYVVYGIALGCGIAGVVLGFYGQAFFATVMVASGGVMAITAMGEVHKEKKGDVG